MNLIRVFSVFRGWMIPEMLIFKSSSNDVYRNLAIEEYLMDQVVDRGPVLFLWQSESAVVMGKNQNPWRECRLDLMKNEGVPLARRISGGGTVYHDAGNLNYCVIVDRVEYREGQAYEMVFRALETLGIHAEKTGKSNLSMGGMKFSGNAFSFRKGRALHHGSLLLNTNLERLNRYLGPMLGEIETHAIASVPAEVANLEVGIDQTRAALQSSFSSTYGTASPERLQESDLDDDLLNQLVDKQMSMDWQYGVTPRFSVEHEGARFEVVKGRISEIDDAGFGNLLDKPFTDAVISWGCQVD